ncbi:TIM-barrel domain-containing protein [Agriterribacter sp.]|uniref:TIM-barrel domain-containing protein n=1 Tax=Agriterribacter sp. TaxID=2821509 RepID=UPI002C8AF4A7|nr:TIM-barrel domain-containing protein [Agriterribacter sp.]HTN06260.1 TIM-barrel domain-containing protein [Agriterribacter sp.]
MKYLIYLSLTFSCIVVSAQEKSFQWQQVAAGVWKAVAGVPEKISPLSIANMQPNTEALSKLGEPPFPVNLQQSVNEIFDAKTLLRFPLEKEEQLFGLGLNFKSVQQRGTIKELQVDHYGGKDDGRTHAPVALYISDKGYGVLINAARRIKVYAGIAVRKDSKNPPEEMNRNTQSNWDPQPYSDAVEIVVPAPGTEVYVFAGSNALQVVQRYNLFCGGGVLPPKWGLGFTQRTPTLFSDKQVMEEVDAFEQRGYPLSFIGLEPGWQTYSYPNNFVWDSIRFSQPQKFVRGLLDKNIRVNLWINPYVSSHSPIYKDVLPYTGTHTVWAGVVPDLTLPPVQDLYKKLFSQQHLGIGVSGYKVDETDGFDVWLWPDGAKFPSGLSGEQMRQVYGLQFQKMSDQWFREKNQRTYGLTRASNTGAPSLPYVIYNDYYNHRDFITALCNSSFIGVLWTPEARSSKTSEEWLRRMQSVCFSPMAMLNAWADGTKPWTFADVADEVKSVMLLRMQLLPYLYNAFAQYHFEGKPPVRAMNLEEGFFFNAKEERGNLNSSDNPYETAIKQDIKDQYMLGDYLLVAPMFAGEKTRKVVLPKGNWYDFYTGRLAGNGAIIEIEPGLQNIPLFVKEGAIIPMIPPVLHTPRKNEILPLTVRHYGHTENSIQLYDDDGETFDYEKGAYARALLSVKKDKKGKLKGSAKLPESKAFHYNKITWEFMTK